MPVLTIVAAVLIFFSGWAIEGLRKDQEIAEIRQQIADADRASLERLAAANLRADGINLRLAAAEAEREVRLQEKDHEIRRLTVGRRCLDAGVVRLLNDNAGIKSAGGMPQATVEPVRADAAFATDTDVGTWIGGCQRSYDTCRARLDGLSEFFAGEK